MRPVNYFQLVVYRVGVFVLLIGIIELVNGHWILGIGFLALGIAFSIGLIIKQRYNQISLKAYDTLNKVMFILMIVGIVLVGFGFYNYIQLYT